MYAFYFEFLTLGLVLKMVPILWPKFLKVPIYHTPQVPISPLFCPKVVESLVFFFRIIIKSGEEFKLKLIFETDLNWSIRFTMKDISEKSDNGQVFSILVSTKRFEFKCF